ncbi:MAG: hypothetical protein K2X81_19790, partial [Candidatus Obscuribacterales bacterium]|nr:hypothetical protein [Candidatus Obscuribacterales bacterium]
VFTSYCWLICDVSAIMGLVMARFSVNVFSLAIVFFLIPLGPTYVTMKLANHLIELQKTARHLVIPDLGIMERYPITTVVLFLALIINALAELCLLISCIIGPAFFVFVMLFESLVSFAALFLLCAGSLAAIFDKIHTNRAMERGLIAAPRNGFDPRWIVLAIAGIPSVYAFQALGILLVH